MWMWARTRQALHQDGQPESVECSVITTYRRSCVHRMEGSGQPADLVRCPRRIVGDGGSRWSSRSACYPTLGTGASCLCSVRSFGRRWTVWGEPPDARK